MLNFIKKIIKEYRNAKEYEHKFLDFLENVSVKNIDANIIRLKKIGEKIQLSENKLQRVHEHICRKYFDKIIEEDRVSDDEEQIYNKLIKELRVDPSDLFINTDRFQHARSMYRLEHGILPEIENEGILLKANEKLHFRSGATLSKVTTRAGEQFLTKECSGLFWVSSERIGFNGYAKSINIPFNKISSFENHGTNDGLFIYKADKEKPYIIHELSSAGAEIAYAIINHYLGR
jgi:hypothetical protein